MKTVVVQAQQKWECLTVTRHSENAFVIGANEAGQQGWELVTACIYKDPKGATCWTAFLKRPSAGQASKAAAREESASASSNEGEAAPGWNLDGEAFDVKGE